MASAPALALDGSADGQAELPPVFSTPYRRDVIHKVYTCLNTHKFQPKGTHPTAGMDVSADSLDPPTGHGQSRVARMNGGGGGRAGEGGEVASVRGGRQAHPPKAEKVIRKETNKKEKRLALCSAIAATASGTTVRQRGHKIAQDASLPLVVSDEIESVSRASELAKIISSLGLSDDVARLESRKIRSGKPALRGRSKKTGTSVLFVAKNAKMLARACGSIHGVAACSAKSLSVLDLAPGAEPGRLTVYSKAALAELAGLGPARAEAA